ncbi:MAG: hypothetical protein ACT4N2_03825 [Hyphomicrobium sp.]
MLSPDTSDDVFRSQLQTTIASLRYWIPSVADAARVEETETADYWKMSVIPTVTGACPFELLLRADRKFDIIIAGETFEDEAMTSLNEFLAIADAIAQGRIIQRSWISSATGVTSVIETIVSLDGERTWRRQRNIRPLAEHSDPFGNEKRDRHFLCYRR